MRKYLLFIQSQKDDFGPRISDGRSPLASESNMPQAKDLRIRGLLFILPNEMIFLNQVHVKLSIVFACWWRQQSHQIH